MRVGPHAEPESSVAWTAVADDQNRPNNESIRIADQKRSDEGAHASEGGDP